MILDVDIYSFFTLCKMHCPFLLTFPYLWPALCTKREKKSIQTRRGPLFTLQIRIVGSGGRKVCLYVGLFWGSFWDVCDKNKMGEVWGGESYFQTFKNRSIKLALSSGVLFFCSAQALNQHWIPRESDGKTQRNTLHISKPTIQLHSAAPAFTRESLQQVIPRLIFTPDAPDDTTLKGLVSPWRDWTRDHFACQTTV